MNVSEESKELHL